MQVQGGTDSPFSIKWSTRNRLLFIKKYKCYGVFTKSFFYVTRIFIALKYKLSNQNEKLKALIEGIREGRKAIIRQEKF